MNKKLLNNNANVVFTKHARERLKLRRINEQMVLQVVRNPDAVYKEDNEKIKLIGKTMGAKVHVIVKQIPEENKLLVISLWVRGEDDAGNFVSHRKHRVSSEASMIYSFMIFIGLLIFIFLYFMSS